MTDQEKIEFLATRVMGWYRPSRQSDVGFGYWSKTNETGGETTMCCNWNPLLSISDAWMVVEKMRERNLSFMVGFSRDEGQYFCDVWDAARTERVGSTKELLDMWNKGEAFGDTAPLAICNAALASVGVKDV